MPTSSTALILESQTGENVSTLPSSDTITDVDTVSDDNLPIALRKGKRTCTSNPISRFVSYTHLSPSHHTFISSIDSYFVPKSKSEALSIPEWKDAMKEEMLAPEQNGTRDLALLPPGKKAVGCR